LTLTVQVNIRSDIKEIINWLHNILGSKIISLLPSHPVPESLYFRSVLDKSTAVPTRRIHKGFFIEMSVKFKYYNITIYMSILSKLHMIYIILYSEYFTAGLISVS